MASPSKSRLWLAVLVCLAVIIGWAFLPQIEVIVNERLEYYVEKSEKHADDDDGTDDQVQNGIVQIEDELFEKVGLKTSVTVSQSFFPETRVLVTVADLTPILNLRTQYLNTVMQKKVAEINQRAASEELARLKKVAKLTGSVASKNIVYADFSLQEAQAKKIGLEQSLASLHEQIINKWGPELASWVEDAESEQWQEILRRKEQLLYVTIPNGLVLPENINSIRLSKDQLALSNNHANRISASSVISQQPQGSTYLFKTKNKTLHSGMRLDGWIPKTEQQLEGVFVPDHAIVWYEGEPWAYIRLTDDLYQRRSLKKSVKAAKGLFESDTIKEDEELVVEGAQMLLSEEFKWQIMDEDDDD